MDEHPACGNLKPHAPHYFNVFTVTQTSEYTRTRTCNGVKEPENRDGR